MKKILAIAIVVGAAFWVLPTDAEAGGLKIPVHGNWCGPGHSGGDTVDALDEACKRHDECYERNEYLDCMCDAQLIKDIYELRAEELLNEVIPREGIHFWFTDVQPCPSGNNPVEDAKTLADGKLGEEDIEAGINLGMPTSPVPVVREVEEAAREVAVGVAKKAICLVARCK